MNLRRLRRVLATMFPVNRRVVVTIDDDLEGRLGECGLDGNTIRIALAPAGPAEMAFTLVHEWAHARIFDRHGKQRNYHTREWAAEYARIYRRIFE